jgi:hypothetical protein
MKSEKEAQEELIKAIRCLKLIFIYTEFKSQEGLPENKIIEMRT